jgi:predicted nuclease of restriction endonuclease-like (RecB) superfamily
MPGFKERTTAMGLTNPVYNNPAYVQWLSILKVKVHAARIKAAVTVNRELLLFYWELGAEIVCKQAQSNWGDGFLSQLSKDLMAEFPDMKGFSRSNIKYIKQWYLFYSQSGLTAKIAKQAVSQFSDVHPEKISQQLVGQLHVPEEIVTHIPWGHNIAIVTKCKNRDEALYYVRATITHNWSRAVLIHQMETGLYHREGKAVSNFVETLPAPQSDLAQQTLKDPYVFDFMALSADCNERDLEKKLVDHITNFLLELGAGFAYLGKQVPVQVGEREFFIDLLFYHARLHCYVVVELKTVDFEPEHAGKLNFYIKAVDEQLRQQGDEPTIGILLCKGRDRLVAEYALSDINKPIGVSEYQLTQSLPENLKSSLPSIEEIEAELSNGLDP